MSWSCLGHLSAVATAEELAVGHSGAVDTSCANNWTSSAEAEIARHKPIRVNPGSIHRSYTLFCPPDGWASFADQGKPVQPISDVLRGGLKNCTSAGDTTSPSTEYLPHQSNADKKIKLCTGPSSPLGVICESAHNDAFQWS